MQRSQQGDYLLLWTKGDQEFQKWKLSLSGLGKYFRQVYIFEQKTKPELMEIIEAHHLSLSETWVVGDSIRSEINPALEVGANAIWIAVDAWRFEVTEPIRDGFIKLSRISELLDVYPRLRG